MKPPAIPDHTLLRPIGRGAYGEVWLARNVMGTLRAVKIIWRRQFESERPYEREFAGIQRYEPLSRSADGLVHVLHVGRNDAEGNFYYVMELADNGLLQDRAGTKETTGAPRLLRSDPSDPFDGTLAYAPRTLRFELKRLGRLPTADCLRIALDAVSGLAQLHRRGLVHRDVKPGNIIYVEGRAKLADLGLVTTSDEAGTFVGTEGYVPPEGPGSTSADIYALGITVYEASTGYPPERFPEAPPEWFAETAPAEPLELHQVLLKACEGQRERRYNTVEAMQADLALLQSGQSIRRLHGLEAGLRRWRRLGGLAALVLACAVIVAALARYREKIMSGNLARESRLRDETQTALTRATNAEEGTRQQLYTALLEQARATVRSGEFGQRAHALDAVRRAAEISNTPELRRVALAAMLLPDFRFLRDLATGPGITVAQIDPEFGRIALCRGAGAVEIRSAVGDQLLAELSASTNLPAYGAWWSPNGKYLAVKRDETSRGDLAELEVWDVGSARRVLWLHDVPWGAMAFRPPGGEMICASSGGGISFWTLKDGQEIRRLQAPSTAIRLCFAPDGIRFAAVCEGSGDEEVWVYDASGGTPRVGRAFSHHLGVPDWQPRGRWLAVPDSSGAISLLDSTTGEVRVLGHHKAEAVTAVFNPAGTYLISGGWDRELICWDMATLQKAFVLGLDSFLVNFQAHGPECAVVTDAAVQIHLFEMPNGHESAEDLGPRVRNAAFSPDGRWLAASGDEQLGVWDLTMQGPCALLPEGRGARLFFSADSSQLFANRDSEGIRWQVLPANNGDTPPVLRSLEFPRVEGLTSFCLASNGLALTGSQGSCLVALNGLGAGSRSWVATSSGLNNVSADNRWLGIFAPFSNILNIYRLPGIEYVASLTNDTSIASFAFSPSGEDVAIASHRALEFWSTKDWTRKRQAPAFMGIIFEPDGRTGWLHQNFRSAGLYNLEPPELLLPLPAGMWPLALSHDGQWLAASVDARRVRLLNLKDLRAQLRALGLDRAPTAP